MSKRPKPPDESRAEAIPTRRSRPVGERSTDAPLPPGMRRKVKPDDPEPKNGRRRDDPAVEGGFGEQASVSGSGSMGAPTTFTSGEATIMNVPSPAAKVRSSTVSDDIVAPAPEEMANGRAREVTLPRMKPSDFEPAPHQVQPAKHPRFSPLDLLPANWAFMLVVLLHVAAAAFAVIYFG